MHPYEVAQTLRSRAKHESIRLNYGSLYSVVELLERRGFVRAARDGARGPAPRAHDLRDHRHRRARAERLALRARRHAGQGVPPVRGRAVVAARPAARRRGRRCSTSACTKLEVQLAQIERRRSSADATPASRACSARERVRRGARARRARLRRGGSSRTSSRASSTASTCGAASSRATTSRGTRPKTPNPDPVPGDIMAPVIEAHNLAKRYRKVRALDGLDLVAEAGQVVALLGPNGAGKTTFVRTVATLAQPDSGTLRVAGIDAIAEPERVRRLIGLAGQYAAVEPTMTGRENLEMVARLFGLARRARAPRADAVLERLRPRRGGRPRWSRPTPAACAARSTSAPAWSARRGCCCSTSRRPVSIPAAASSCGTRSARSSTAAPTCCSPPSTSTRPTSWPTDIVIIDHGRVDRGRARRPS